MDYENDEYEAIFKNFTEYDLFYITLWFLILIGKFPDHGLKTE